MALPFIRAAGTHREVGQEYGAACAELVARHRDLALTRLESAGVSAERAVTASLEYRPYVRAHAAFLDEEIQGLAEGAGISLGEAYLLQLRSEVYAHLRAQWPSTTDDNECTTFAVLAEATPGGVPLAGQNADLPAYYTDVLVVAHLQPDEGPAILMVMPAGQISYIGINDRGMGAFANFLHCDGWQLGFPRYLLSRLALHHGTLDGALAAFRGLRRASSRNLMLLDGHAGRAADVENTPARDAVLEPEDGLLAHTNHYVAEELAAEERTSSWDLENSRARLDRMRLLLRSKHGQLDAATMAALLRDRAGFPHCLSRCAGDDPSTDTATICSVIAEPTTGRMWVAPGPPSDSRYTCYSFAGGHEPDRWL